MNYTVSQKVAQFFFVSQYIVKYYHDTERACRSKRPH